MKTPSNDQYDEEENYPPECWVEDNLVVVRDDELLPARCIFTNVPVERRDMVGCTLYYVPLWAYLFLPLGLLPVALVILIIRKPVRITYGLSPEVWWRVFWMRSIGITCMVVGFFGLFVALANESGAFIAVALVLLLGGIIAAFMSQTNPAVSRCQRSLGRRFGNDEFWLRGFGREFLKQLDEETRD
ncbi:MAG: hypothetical protein KDA69_09690 [Planctomycetaceae bacterium]|nr:hypothetical protein [Planctomycetaceae bacterium]